VWNSEGEHTIWLFDPYASDFTLVVQSPILNFQQNILIINPFVKNGVLFWTYEYDESFLGVDDVYGYNPPRQIDIQKAIDGEYSLDLFQALDVIKWPPRFAPKVEYGNDGTNTQRLYGGLYQFIYRYIYDNEQESCFSPISKVALPNFGYWMSGQNLIAVNEDNTITVEINTGSTVVRKIEIAYRRGNNGTFYIYETIDKVAQGVADNTVYESTFNNTIAGQALPLNIRNFDAVPQVVKCQETLPNGEVVYANFFEDYTSSASFLVEQTLRTVRSFDLPIKATVPYVQFTNNPALNRVVFNFAPTINGGLFGFAEGDVIPFQLREWNGTNYEGAITYNYIVGNQTSVTSLIADIETFLENAGFTVGSSGALMTVFNAK
jgi:hypothetical protein